MILAEKIMKLRKKNGWSPAGRGIYGESQKDRQENRKMGCHLLATGDGSVSWI